jgi:uncharacterized membrane protein
MVDKKTGWGLVIIGVVLVAVAAVAFVYLHSQHPGALTQFADGHRTSLKSVGNWKSAMIVVAAVAVVGVVAAGAGLGKVVRT